MQSFINWLRGVDRSSASPTYQETVTPDTAAKTEEKVTTPTLTQAESVTQKSSRGTSFSQTDIDILQAIYGEFYPGMIITIPLSDACVLLGRKRQRVDAFKRLQQVLKAEYDVTLTITSRKTHGEN